MSSVVPTQIEAIQELEQEKMMEQPLDVDGNDCSARLLKSENSPQKICIMPKEDLLLESKSIDSTCTESLRDKSRSLIDIANCTFRELCKTLECEQAKLRELEEKRIKLHEEMQRLKAEIEEEKNIYNLHLSGKYKEEKQTTSSDAKPEVQVEEKQDTIENDVADEADEAIDYDTTVHNKESTMDYIKRQRQRLEIINQEYSLSEFSEDDCVSMNMNTEEDAAAGKDQEALAAHIIDQCIPSNLSLPHH